MRGNLNIQVACEPVLRRLARLSPEDRAREAHRMWSQILEVQASVAAARRSGIRELRATGMTLAQIGGLLGLSITRVKQMEQGERR